MILLSLIMRIKTKDELTFLNVYYFLLFWLSYYFYTIAKFNYNLDYVGLIIVMAIMDIGAYALFFVLIFAIVGSKIAYLIFSRRKKKLRLRS